MNYIIFVTNEKGDTYIFDSTTDRNKVQEFLDKAASYPDIIKAWVVNRG